MILSRSRWNSVRVRLRDSSVKTAAALRRIGREDRPLAEPESDALQGFV
jgi:hypothetical protein